MNKPLGCFSKSSSVFMIQLLFWETITLFRGSHHEPLNHPLFWEIITSLPLLIHSMSNFSSRISNRLPLAPSAAPVEAEYFAAAVLHAASPDNKRLLSISLSVYVYNLIDSILFIFNSNQFIFYSIPFQLFCTDPTQSNIIRSVWRELSADQVTKMHSQTQHCDLIH